MRLCVMLGFSNVSNLGSVYLLMASDLDMAQTSGCIFFAAALDSQLVLLSVLSTAFGIERDEHKTAPNGPQVLKNMHVSSGS